MNVMIRTPQQILAEGGVNANTAWSDDAGLTDIQRGALRSTGRNDITRKYNETGQYLNTAGQGMSANGGQMSAASPAAPVASAATTSFAGKSWGEMT